MADFENRRARHDSAPKAIEIVSIDLSEETHPWVDADQVLREELEKVGLFSEDYLYSAFRPELLDLVQRTGSYRSATSLQNDDIPETSNAPGDWIFACSVLIGEDGEPAIYDLHTYDSEFSMPSILNQTCDGLPEGFIAVYTRSEFTERLPAAQFNNPSDKLAALRAIVKVRL